MFDTRARIATTDMERRLAPRLIAVAAVVIPLIGVGTVRADIPGACCFGDGVCEPYGSAPACVDDGGTFAGVGVTCEAAACATLVVTCDEPLEIVSCPRTIVIETRDANGVIFEMPNSPAARGCDVVVVLNPPLGDVLPVGENAITVLATDAFGDMAACRFSVVVDLVGESGAMPKRRLKGGGRRTPPAVAPIGGCAGSAFSLLVDPSMCGSCGSAGMFLSIAGIVGFRRKGPL